jgi:ABC-type uncharacterized transport system substrate-binding protein
MTVIFFMLIEIGTKIIQYQLIIITILSLSHPHKMFDKKMTLKVDKSFCKMIYRIKKHPE